VKTKHISKMSEMQMTLLKCAVQDAAVRFAKEHGFSGLSHNGWFNFYAALDDAIEGEWRKATTHNTENVT